MPSSDYLNRLEHIARQEFAALERNVIVREGDRYWAFGLYEIRPYQKQFQVLKYTSEVDRFRDIKTAISWCVADKFGKWHLARDIQNLSRTIAQITDDLSVREHAAKTIRDQNAREGIQCKLSSKKHKLQRARDQLEKCLNLAKYWQLRGFNNETARTGRPPSSRTSR